MQKRIISAVLCILLAVSIVFAASGCSSGNYPVTIGHSKISEKPEKVVVLSDNLADIIVRLGYSAQLAGISDACTQEELTRYVSSVGSENNPDVDTIVATGAKYVLAEGNLPDSAKTALSDKGITVIEIMTPTTPEELKSVYITLGKFFGGEPDGTKMGEGSYTQLTTTLTKVESQIDSNEDISFCYLYLDERGILSTFPYNNNISTQEGLLFDYVCATNVFADAYETKVDQDILSVSNPDYIFYNDQKVIDYLEDSTNLHKMTALKNGKTVMLPLELLQRQGSTMLNTQKNMLSKMYPDSITAVETVESLASLYGIELTEDMKYEYGMDDSNVKIIQERLIDLGYLVLDSGDTPTTYYGGNTQTAVEDFQSNNALESTGVADYETLTVLFMSTTLSVDGKTALPDSASNPQETENPEETQAPEETTSSGEYTITFFTDSSFQEYSSGEEVEAIQQRLVSLNYLTADNVTGSYLGNTIAAVEAFQRDNGISVTGVCDYDTLCVLFPENV